MHSSQHLTATDDTTTTPLRDRGASTVEVLGWAAMSTVALVAIGAALQTLGVDIINNVRTQLGL
jgi:hypothetical protein